MSGISIGILDIEPVSNPTSWEALSLLHITAWTQCTNTVVSNCNFRSKDAFLELNIVEEMEERVLLFSTRWCKWIWICIIEGDVQARRSENVP
jgi:hypothetical protein